MRLTERHVCLLAEALSHPRASFILGAGASAPEVPVMGELLKRVFRDFEEQVHSFIPPDEHEPTHYVFADAAPDPDSRERILASTIETLQLLITRNLRPGRKAVETAPLQYALLSSAKSQFPVINYNVDGLARKHCTGLLINPVHGQVPNFVSRIPVQEAVRLTQDGIRIIPEASVWLPEPEREQELFSTIDLAFRDLRSAPQIVIVGYSFGASGSGFADSVSLNALGEYFRDRKVQILVVDPSPNALVGVLAERLRNKQVIGIPVYWNRFAEAVFDECQSHGFSHQRVARLSQAIVRQYVRGAGL